MPQPYSQLEVSSNLLKRRRATSAPCEDDAVRNSKRSRSDVDHFTPRILPILEVQEEEIEDAINKTKIDKGKAKLASHPSAGYLAPDEVTSLNRSAIEELALVSLKVIATSVF